MRKIGICTLYYKNRNYGANLQAYALRLVLEKMGNDVELISYYYSNKIHYLLAKTKELLKRKTNFSDDITLRNKTIDGFNNEIPHSKLYFKNTIDKANLEYDCFITGSDQVWNPDFINKYMALEFVDASKTTAAYAASTGKISLNEVQKQKLIRALSHTKYISIRENDSIPALLDLTEKDISYVLDPTMLLSAREWDAICSDRIIEEKYLFCYFLGDNENLRIVAREYAHQKGLKVVTLPYLNGVYRKVDDGFGDYKLYKVNPADFLSLIKYSSFIMTDSFHAAVFSHLYEKEFVVSSKKENQMGCRMKSLVDLFGTQERYIHDHGMVSIEKLIELESKPMEFNWESYKKMKEYSLDFLKRVINDD